MQSSGYLSPWISALFARMGKMGLSNIWNQTRLGNKKSEKQPQLREPIISWNAIYDCLRGNKKPFPQPIPLPEMVDFLVDVWEQQTRAYTIEHGDAKKKKARKIVKDRKYFSRNY